VDDLREVIKLSQTEGRGTISDILRDLVHEALAYRRMRAMGRDTTEDPIRRIYEQAVSAGINPLEGELKAIKEALRQLKAEDRRSEGSANDIASLIYPFLTEIIGFAMTAEMKTHLLLQNFLLGRGLGEESARKLIAEHEEKSRQNTQKIVVGLMRPQS
jgi:hypothetical protein